MSSFVNSQVKVEAQSGVKVESHTHTQTTMRVTSHQPLISAKGDVNYPLTTSPISVVME